MITHHNIIQGSFEWHKLHDGLWTGSTAIKLLARRKMPKWSTFDGNIYTKRGKILENIALNEYAAQTGVIPLTSGFVTNSRYPKAGYSPDGFTSDTLLEIKCLNGERHENLLKEIPLEYQAQIQFGMVIMQLKKAQLLAFNPEYTPQLTIIDIKQDRNIAKNIRKLLLA